MSYQRAVVNCKECYRLANNNLSPDILDERDLLGVRRHQIWEARNEAMSALEGGTIPNQEKILMECLDCDFKTPRIAESFKDKPYI
jgi:hypothetical protein